MPMQSAGATGFAPVPTAAALGAMADALASEARLLRDLALLMERQRQGVATDDIAQVDETVFATQRVLLTLNEARRRRRSLTRLLGGEDDMSLRALDATLGTRMTESLRRSREDLHEAALQLSRQVELNRHVLREALAANDDYVRTLCGVGSSGVYSADAQPAPTESRGGVLIDRQA